MEIDGIITIAVILIAFILFATERLSVDHVSIGIIVVLGITGVLSIEESLAGFSNTATLTVLAMFVLGDAIIKTGIIESISPFFSKLISKGDKRSILGLSFTVGSMSAFINNTPVVATFIPVITNAARASKKSPSKYLIPLSFGAILGGSCTLIGTSTNLLVDGIARANGQEGFTMFTFAPLGLVFFIVGSLYLMLFSGKILPERNVNLQVDDDSSIEDYLTEIKIIGKKEKQDSVEPGEDKVVGTDELNEKELFSIEEIFKIGVEKEVIVKQLVRDNKKIDQPDASHLLKTGDILLVRGNLKRIKNILNNELLEMTETLGDDIFPEEETRAIELVILPNSQLINRRLGDLDYFDRYQSRVIAIRQRGKKMEKKLADYILKAGDVLLLQANEKGYQMLKRAEKRRVTPFLFLGESGIEKVNSSGLLIVGSIIFAVIALASFNILPLVIGAFAGIFLLVLSKIISMENAYDAVDWKVIFLLAGALCLGEAMNKTGLSLQLANLIETYVAKDYGPIAVISILYLITSLLTETMSNNAAAALLAPIAISISQNMEMNSLPFLMAITFAGSASFMTPIGYQTNTMVYSVGNYKFSDFIKIGLPLNIICWLLATFLIPVFYPF